MEPTNVSKHISSRISNQDFESGSLVSWIKILKYLEFSDFIPTLSHRLGKWSGHRKWKGLDSHWPRTLLFITAAFSFLWFSRPFHFLSDGFLDLCFSVSSGVRQSKCSIQCIHAKGYLSLIAKLSTQLWLKWCEKGGYELLILTYDPTRNPNSNNRYPLYCLFILFYFRRQERFFFFVKFAFLMFHDFLNAGLVGKQSLIKDKKANQKY